MMAEEDEVWAEEEERRGEGDEVEETLDREVDQAGNL